MSLDPKTLKLFTSVIKYGTIAAAAESEHIAAAAVSRRLSDLEEQLGVKLLLRSNKGIEPTPAGQTLLHLSYRVLNDLDNIKSQIQDYAAGIKGHVRIFANISALRQFMPSELSAFVKENPLVKIHLEQRISSEVIQAVVENDADLGVLTMGGVVDGVNLLPYKNDELVVIVPKMHVLASRGSVRFDETIEFDYVGLPAGSRVNEELTRAATELGQPWRIRFKVPSYDALCLMVEAGLGIGILPKHTALLYARILNIQLLKLDEPWAYRKLAICIRSYDALPTPARALVDRMVDGVSNSSEG